MEESLEHLLIATSKFWGFDSTKLKNINVHLASKLAFIYNHFYNRSSVNDKWYELKRTCKTTLDHMLYQTFLNSTSYRCVYGANVVKDGTTFHSDYHGAISVEIFQTGSIGDGLLTVSSDVDIMVVFNKFLASDIEGESESITDDIIVLKKGTTDAFVYIPEKHIMIDLVNTFANDQLFERHGPALAHFIKADINQTHDSEIEFTPCLPLKSWPVVSKQWFSRKRSDWPSSCVIEKCKQAQCYIVPKHHPLNENIENEWRYSMSIAEKILAQSLTQKQKETYIVTKFILKTNMIKEGGISSYHLKTVTFWLYEELPTAFWEERSIADNTRALLSRLLCFLEEGNIPNFFIPTANLIGHLNKNTLEKGISKCKVILKDIKKALINKEIVGAPKSLKVPFPISQLASWEDIDSERQEIVVGRIYCNYLYRAMLDIGNDMFEEAKKALREVPYFIEYYVQKVTVPLVLCDEHCTECDRISSVDKCSFKTMNTLIALVTEKTAPFSFKTCVNDQTINTCSESFSAVVMMLYKKPEHSGMFAKLIRSLDEIETDEDKQTVLGHLFLKAVSHAEYMVNNQETYIIERDQLFKVIHCMQEALQILNVHKSIIAVWKSYRSNYSANLTAEYYKKFNLDANIIMIESMLASCHYVMEGSDPNILRYLLVHNALLTLLTNKTNAVKESLYFGLSISIYFVIMAKDFKGLHEIIKIIKTVSTKYGEEGKNVMLPILNELLVYVENPLMASEQCVANVVKFGSLYILKTGSLDHFKKYSRYIIENSGLPYLFASIAESIAAGGDILIAKDIIQQSLDLFKENEEIPPDSIVSLRNQLTEKTTANLVRDFEKCL